MFGRLTRRSSDAERDAERGTVDLCYEVLTGMVLSIMETADQIFNVLHLSFKEAWHTVCFILLQLPQLIVCDLRTI